MTERIPFSSLNHPNIDAILPRPTKFLKTNTTSRTTIPQKPTSSIILTNNNNNSSSSKRRRTSGEMDLNNVCDQDAMDLVRARLIRDVHAAPESPATWLAFFQHEVGRRCVCADCQRDDNRRRMTHVCRLFERAIGKHLLPKDTFRHDEDYVRLNILRAKHLR